MQFVTGYIDPTHITIGEASNATASNKEWIIYDEQYYPLEHQVSTATGRVTYLTYYYKAPGFDYGIGKFPRLGKKHFIINLGGNAVDDPRLTFSIGSNRHEGIPTCGFSLMQSNNVKIDQDCDLHPFGPPPATIDHLTNGNWHRVTIKYTAESSSQALDGAFEVWIDGEKVNDNQGIGTGTLGVENIELASTFNGGSPKNQTEYYGNITIWTGSYTNVSNATDTTPPIVTVNGPSGTLASGTTNATLSVTTNEAATCKYGSAGTAYASMAGSFTTADGFTHTAALTGLANGTYNYAVRCQDTSGNADTTDTPISFTIAQQRIGDLNNDGVVNVQDLVIAIQQIRSGTDGTADLNGDGVVDIFDLVDIVSHWG